MIYHSPAESADLSRITLFNGLSQEELAELSRHLRHKIFPALTPILTMGQRSSVIYFIQQGTIRICAGECLSNDILLAIVGPGEVLGEINAVDNLGHSASAVAIETCSLLWMECEAFHSCRRQMPTLTDNLLQMLAYRARFVSTRLQVMATASVCGRLAAQLLMFADQYGCPAEHGAILIPLRITQTDLASLIGASRQHTSLVLSTLKKRQLLSLDTNHRIIIHRRAALERCT